VECIKVHREDNNNELNNKEIPPEKILPRKHLINISKQSIAVQEIKENCYYSF